MRAPTVAAGAGMDDAAAPPSAPPAPRPACAAIDLDDLEALEPPEPTTQTRTSVRVAALARVAEPRRSANTFARHDLGQVDVHPVLGHPHMHSSTGMGWGGLEPGIVRDALHPALREPFEGWVDARKRWADLLSAVYLIGQRVRYLESMPRGPSDWGGWACSTAAEADLAVQLDAARKRLHDSEATLVQALRQRGPIGPHARYLLATLETGPDASDPPADARAELRTLAEDADLDPELRARAFVELARTSSDVHGPAFAHALRAATALSRDRELQLSSLLKLAQVEPGPAQRLALYRELLVRIETDGGGWREGLVASHAAELAAAGGDFLGAVELGARCARASQADFPRNDDPWGCASVMAEALVELGPDRLPSALEVPARFVGPLSLAWIKAALGVHDRDQALQLAEAALAEVPMAEQAPEILTLLIALSDDARRRATLEGRLAREYAVDGEWWSLHRERLAWRYKPEALRDQLERLGSPTNLANTAGPKSAAQVMADLRGRAHEVATACVEHFDASARPVTVSVDTTGSSPPGSSSGRDRNAKSVRAPTRARALLERRPGQGEVHPRRAARLSGTTPSPRPCP